MIWRTPIRHSGPPHPCRRWANRSCVLVKRAELALGGLSSAEPRLGQPWPPFDGSGGDLGRLSQHGRAYLGERVGLVPLGDGGQFALQVVQLAGPRVAERVGVVAAAIPVV